MKEEDNIRKKVSTENPFTVPEGYFDNLTDEIMSKLPEKEEILPTKELSTGPKYVLGYIWLLCLSPYYYQYATW